MSHSISKTIYLIRHGETEYNRKGIVQGSGVDADLNDLGRAQANSFYEFYKHIKFDKVYISKLKRTYQSVQNFLEVEHLPYEAYAGLNEISWGIKEGKMPNYLDDQYYKDLIHNWRTGNVTMPTEQGESPMDVRLRQMPVIDVIISRPEEQTILMCMHGRAIRILLTTLLEKPLSEMDTFDHQNLCLYVLTYHYDENKFTLETQNDTTHLLLLPVEDIAEVEPRK
ncbi:MAG: histidine phosphatase family protein [Spirosomataceae bacterium]